MIEFLRADGPHPALGDQAGIFGRFIGGWELDCRFTAADGTRTDFVGSWHFGWILQGRAIQDVLRMQPAGDQAPKAEPPPEPRIGTTLRLFDPKAGRWLTSWFGASSGFAVHLAGGAVGERIVLRGRDVDGAPLRWSFNDIARDRCRWLGETSIDEGEIWRVEQEMWLRRLPPTGAKQ